MNKPHQKLKHDLAQLDYKNPEFLSNYISEVAMISPARITKAPAAFQRKLAKEIKRARFLALMPYC